MGSRVEREVAFHVCYLCTFRFLFYIFLSHDISLSCTLASGSTCTYAAYFTEEKEARASGVVAHSDAKRPEAVETLD